MTAAPIQQRLETMTEEEFCTRFVAEMMKAAPIYDGSPEDLRAYAVEVAPTYWSETSQREDGPRPAQKPTSAIGKRARR